MILPDFLAKDGVGEIRLTGHRIGLFHLVHYYNEGFSPEMLVCQYPTLPLALVHKVIAFYLENRAEVDSYIRKSRESLDHLAAGAQHGPDAEGLRRRMEARRPKESA